MEKVIVPVLIGTVLIVIGFSNLKGDIRALHKYHRKRVSEEDRMAFGKIEGIGTIICGISVILCGLIRLSAATGANKIADTVMFIGLAIGLGISFYGMFKYNKGIF